MNFENITKKNTKRRMKSTRQIRTVLPKMKKLETIALSKSMITAPNNCVSKRLQREFFAKKSNVLAKNLLGKILCRVVEDPSATNGEHTKDTKKKLLLKARIVETEMYPGITDPASHSYQGKKTTRNGAMFMDPGVCYVYNIYGMYQCLNISSLEPGGCVLLRALEPIEGIELMIPRRQANKKKRFDKMKETELCSGPSKLCQAFGITKNLCNGADLVSSDHIWIENASDVSETNIVSSKRIGIESAGAEVANRLYRFYERYNRNVSVRDKSSELSMSSD